MRPVDYALAAAVASIVAAITLVLLAPTVVETHNDVSFASVSEPRFDPPKPQRTYEPAPTIVESESAQPQGEFADAVEDAVWGVPEPAWEEQWLEPEPEPETDDSEPEDAPEMSETASHEAVEASDFKDAGVTVQGGTRFTWYSAHEPGGEVDAECSADADGIYRDADGYIVVASGDLGMGDVVETPLGDGKVYDRCPTPGVVDVYTDWSA